ncbi:cytochrome c maturation protein CcmE [bacterium]|nr:MAG: cytochrome c maturation protein CcmE [bacterium]
MKPKVIIGVILIVGFTSLLMYNFGNSISAYVDFKTAEQLGNRNVHVVGAWDKAQPAAFSIATKTFSFYMTDEHGNSKRVIYAKPKPNNFDDAERLVVIGQLKNDVFYADEMLMKCPSKYNDASGAEFEKAEH